MKGRKDIRTQVAGTESPMCGNRVAPLQGLTISGAPHVGLRPTLLPDALSGLHRVERPRANGVRTFLSARNSNVQCGQECPHSVRAESPTGISVGCSPTNGGRASSRAVRAESPPGTSVGRSPTNGGRASSRAVRAESPTGISVGRSPTNGGRASSRAVRAESPTGTSEGRSPTSRGLPPFQALKGRNQRG